MITVLIAETDPSTRARLRTFLTTHGMRVIDAVPANEQAIDLAQRQKPQVVLLGMPTRLSNETMDGLSLARRLRALPNPPFLICLVANAEEAAQATAQGAGACVTRPVTSARLRTALKRAQSLLEERHEEEAQRRQMEAVEASRHAEHRESAPVARLAIRGAGAVHMIRTSDIVCVETRNRQVHVVTVHGDYRTSYTVRELAALLPAERFLRVHACCIINLELVEEVRTLGAHSYEVALSNGKRYPVSRRRYGALRRWLGL